MTDILEKWEAEAEEFYRDTFYVRPGKDDFRNMHTHEERSGAFHAWCLMRRKYGARAQAPAFAAAAPLLAPHADEVVSEAMVEAAARSRYGEEWNLQHYEWCDRVREDVRAMLTAALRARAQKGKA